MINICFIFLCYSPVIIIILYNYLYPIKKFLIVISIIATLVLQSITIKVEVRIAQHVWTHPISSNYPTVANLMTLFYI